MKGSFSCRICRTWLEGAWSRAKTKALRDLLQAQMDQGMCTRCAIKRETRGQLLARLDEMEHRVAQQPRAGERLDYLFEEMYVALQEIALINIELAQRALLGEPSEQGAQT